MSWFNVVMEKMNQKDYKFYCVNKEGTKIRSGWEYKEDAQDAKEEDDQVGKILTAMGLKKLELDPNNDKHWG